MAKYLEPTDRLIGQRMGDFEIEQRLGRGGMGVVYRARQVGLDRLVAVKVLDPSLSPASGERFRREALAASRLEHPNIAAVLAFGEHEEFSYYAMQFVDGWSLRQLLDGGIEGGPDLTDPKVVAHLFREAAAALAYTHEQGVIHRDVSPRNLLIDRREHRLHVIDFGLARIASLDAISRTGQASGTPLYMSPEQIRAERDQVDHRTDIYSLGVVLYEALAGVPPFQGASIEQILYRITHDHPRSITAAAPSVPRDLETIAMKALRREREDRYETALEMCEDLDRFLVGAAIHARPLRPWDRLGHQMKRPRTWKLVTPALILTALVSGFCVSKTTTETETRKATLNIGMPAGADRATVTIAKMDPVTEAVKRADVDRALPLAGLRLDAGLYRIVVHVAGLGSAEYDRMLEAQTSTTVTPTPFSLARNDGDMVRIPAGVYRVGGRLGPAPYNGATREVAAFRIDRTEVSCARYRRFLAANRDVRPPWGSGPYSSNWDKKPVFGVSFDDAQRFAEWEGKRLPTWTEWQVAARGPQSRLYPWGDEPGRISETAVVIRARGSKWLTETMEVDGQTGDVSAFGVRHMFGNVREWTSSVWVDWVGQRPQLTPTRRIIQGFGWSSDLAISTGLQDLTSATPAQRQWRGAGFRCATTDRP
ncbi:MAG: SUMF1/EgtB/PvdO family nonheme iron enzyme [Planctomycetes bacterium]|nr:SUMF1/EgtB/PvdO family nonheme iron enzyme [Planctomycetota bacterium]